MDDSLLVALVRQTNYKTGVLCGLVCGKNVQKNNICKSNYGKLVRYLWMKGVLGDIGCVFVSSVFYKNMSVIRFLVGKCVKCVINIGLKIGVACDRYDIVRLLLDNGADVYANGGYECAISVYRNSVDMVRLLDSYCK